MQNASIPEYRIGIEYVFLPSLSLKFLQNGVRLVCLEFLVIVSEGIVYGIVTLNITTALYLNARPP